MKHFVTMLIYMHRMVEGCVFSLINMPLIAMRAGQYMSIYVAAALICMHKLVTWYLRLHTWYLGSMTQCIRNHSLFARLIHNFDWRIYKFFLPARLALVQSGLCWKMFQWFMVRHDHGYLSLDVGSPMMAGLYNCIKLSIMCCIISLCCH